MITMNWDKANPLARCQGETKRASVALADYALMGPGRSLAKLVERYRDVYKTSSVKPPTMRLPTLAGWSMRNAWQDRVAAWEDIKRAEAEAEWSRRRTELCEIEWGKARQLLERAEAMLKLPLTEKIVDSDGGTVVVKPVRWTAADIARYMETASKLMRLAAGMETERTDVTSKGEKIGSGLTDDQRLELLAQLAERTGSMATGPDTGE